MVLAGFAWFWMVLNGFGWVWEGLGGFVVVVVVVVAVAVVSQVFRLEGAKVDTTL